MAIAEAAKKAQQEKEAAEKAAAEKAAAEKKAAELAAKQKAEAEAKRLAAEEAAREKARIEEQLANADKTSAAYIAARKEFVTASVQARMDTLQQDYYENVAKESEEFWTQS